MTYCRGVECHETTQPVNLSKDCDKSFLELTSPTVSTYMDACNSSSLPKHKHVM